MTPLLQSFKRIWLCTLRQTRPFVATRIDPYLTPHRVELLRKVFAHLDVAIDGQRNPAGGVLQARIVSDFAVCKSSISRMLCKMERDGFIYRTRWSMNVLYKVVHLTPLGFEVMNIVRSLRFDEAAPDTQIFSAFLGDPARDTDVDGHPNAEATTPPTSATAPQPPTSTPFAPNVIVPTTATSDAVDDTPAAPVLETPLHAPQSAVGRTELEALYQQCNAIRIGLRDNARHLHPWCMREGVERYADPELGISYWRPWRLRKEDVDDRILDELPDEYLAVAGPFRPHNDVEDHHAKWRRPFVA